MKKLSKILILTIVICMYFFFSYKSKINQEDTNSTYEHIDIVDKESEDKIMRLFINDLEIPVSWDDNQTVRELMEDIDKNEIIVEMTMYGGNEQFGYLGKNYFSNNHQMTTESGDIVLYDDCNIVVFYGSNSWSYTYLGHMNLDSKDVKDLLSNGNVILTLRK